MSTKKIQYVQDIYDLAPGGTTEIAYKLKKSIRTIERWKEVGINDTYWADLHRLYGVTPYELFKLNSKIRGYKAV